MQEAEKMCIEYNIIMVQVNNFVAFLMILIVSVAASGGFMVAMMFGYIMPKIKDGFDDVDKNVRKTLENINSMNDSTKSYLHNEIVSTKGTLNIVDDMAHPLHLNLKSPSLSW